MKTTQKTSIPEETSDFQKIASKFIHNGMYLLLILIVLSGLLIGYLYWLTNTPFLIKITITFHEIVINLLYVFIGIHILAAIYHRLKKDGVWSSMVPFLKEK